MRCVIALILLFVVVTFAVGFIIYLYGVLRASRSIHKQLMQSVLGSTLRCVNLMTLINYCRLMKGIFFPRWLDTTPTSRVITRATQDMRDGAFIPIPSFSSCRLCAHHSLVHSITTTSKIDGTQSTDLSQTKSATYYD